MAKHEIAALSCRLLAIYAVLASFGVLPLALAPLLPTSGMIEIFGREPQFSWLAATPFSLHLVAAGFLWRGADFLARHMIKTATSPANPILIFDASARPTAFSILGAFVLVQALPKIGQMLVQLWLVVRQDPMLQRDMSGLTFPDFVAIALQIGLGLWLLVGSQGVVGLVQTARNAGRDRD